MIEEDDDLPITDANEVQITMPPEDIEVTDEDSGPEDCPEIDNLPGSQLRAHVEVELLRGEDVEPEPEQEQELEAEAKTAGRGGKKKKGKMTKVLLCWKENEDIPPDGTVWLEGVHRDSPFEWVRPTSTQEVILAKRKVQLQQPGMIASYNQSMGGVDRSDQNVSLYRTSIRGKKNCISA